MSDCNKPKTNGCGCPPPVIIPGEINGPPGAIGEKGTTGDSGTNGIDGIDGIDGTNGIDGRGVAAFVQNTQPTQTDFNNDYGTIDGFGVNGIPGSETFKPGDIWINVCP